MKTKLFLILFLVCFSGFSQSLDETKIWIKEQISTLSLQKETDFFSQFTVDYTTTDLVITNNLGAWGTVTSTLPIKQISSVTFEEKSSTVWLIIWMKDNQNLVYCKELKNYSNRAEIILLKDVNNNNMKDRLKKAFSNLVSFYGGSIVPDTY